MTTIRPQAATDLDAEAVKLAAGAIERHCDDLGVEVPSPALARALAIAALRATQPEPGIPEAASGAVLRAISDPGSILPRLDGESVPFWQTRAVLQCAVPLIAAAERDATVGAMYAGAAKAVENAVAAERERLFVAIRHGIPLDKPWRGEALDLISAVWREDHP